MLTHKWLKIQADSFDVLYFSKRLSNANISVRFGVTRDANAHFDPSLKEIVIDQNNAKLNNQRNIKIDLLHEMVHADLDAEGYLGGHMKDRLHGMRFQGEICRLWRIGAYDGLL